MNNRENDKKKDQSQEPAADKAVTVVVELPEEQYNELARLAIFLKRPIKTVIKDIVLKHLTRA